tara:strand:+ start:1178 stop:1480 length:303 start_codon:yes stop_codon:yes gene_type:complete
MFKKLMFVFKHLAVIDTLIYKERTAQLDAETLARKDNLSLCIKHQPEQPGAEFAEHNCHYCQLLKKVENVPTPAETIPNVPPPPPPPPPKIYKREDVRLR